MTLKETLEPSFQQVEIDQHNLPKHIAIIMDGNGRWAKEKNLPRTVGHQQGSNTVRDILKASLDIGIEYLSVYAFSTENWSRPQNEVSFLMNLFEKMLLKELKRFHDNEIRVRIIGDKSGFSEKLQATFKKIEDETSAYSRLNFNIMSNYGARQELVSAVKSIVAEKHKAEDVTEALIEQHLYTHGIPDPDLFIRTSGEYRISNFLLWQISYTELVFCDKFWPDFNTNDYASIIKEYQQRHRRFGGL